jgi:DNA-binding SARP family transcriptional activator
MEKQLPLVGFEQFRLSKADEPGLLRRKSDGRGRQPRRRKAVVRQFPTLKNQGTTWPVIVYTLGRFSVLHHGTALEYGRKVPQRPLLLLKALIALGGRGVSASSLTAILWPDADGDTAKRSFDTTLHRLRRLFGNEPLLVLTDGKVSLDSNCCWVDVWSFERLLGQVQRIRTKDPTGKDAYKLDKLTDRLLGLYQDHFLAGEDMTSWSVSLRERLRSKFIHTLLDVGRYWEIHGFWDKAIRCYQKGLEVDDLIEVFYQRLMSCCLETQRISEGMSVYRRCQQILSVVLGLKPEPETDAIYLLLKKARLQKQTA